MAHTALTSAPAGGAEPLRPASFLGALLLLALLAAAVAMVPRWPGAESAEPELAALATPQARREALTRHLERHPRDGRAWALLAMQEFAADRFDAAAAAFERAVAASPKVAADPAVWCEYADALAMAQGSLAGRPTELVARALALRPNHPKALEMAGSAAYEQREFAQAAAHWKQLLPQLGEGTTPHAQLAAAIERAEKLAATSLR